MNKSCSFPPARDTHALKIALDTFRGGNVVPGAVTVSCTVTRRTENLRDNCTIITRATPWTPGMERPLKVHNKALALTHSLAHWHDDASHGDPDTDWPEGPRPLTTVTTARAIAAESVTGDRTCRADMSHEPRGPAVAAYKCLLCTQRLALLKRI
jgi:hypothetical protein